MTPCLNPTNSQSIMKVLWVKLSLILWDICHSCPAPPDTLRHLPFLSCPTPPPPHSTVKPIEWNIKSETHYQHIPSYVVYFTVSGWLGWAMVLGSFQCRGILLLLHIVGQGPAVPAAGAGWVGCIFFYFFTNLPFLVSCLLGDGWTWLKYCSFGC